MGETSESAHDSQMISFQWLYQGFIYLYFEWDPLGFSLWHVEIQKTHV